MNTIAIIGGGIAGLAAAYELEKARRSGAAIDWHLFEAGSRLGGTVETTRHTTADGTYILEGGPDGWVTDKPWAHELAEELGLGGEIIPSNDADRKTWIVLDGSLQAIPDGMRMMVPEDLAAVDHSPLFTDTAKRAFHDEFARADELKAATPEQDESVASFVRRHFGDEVLDRVGAPLLSGVFGGDVERLSVRAVMPAFVRMEREHGSLIAAVQHHARERGDKPRQPIFTTLRRGMGSLVEAIAASLPPERLHLGTAIASLAREPDGWRLGFGARSSDPDHGQVAPGTVWHELLLAAPVDTARHLLQAVDPAAAALIPADASSATLATFCWPAIGTPEGPRHRFTPPPGFGFLNPQVQTGRTLAGVPQLLAATFVDQKFSHRCPAGARVLRVFFGSGSTEFFAGSPDTAVAQTALEELRRVLGSVAEPDSTLTTVRRWPRSLPQYEVGHPSRMAELDRHVAALRHLSLLGNGYRGVGVPDLIRDARSAARKLLA